MFCETLISNTQNGCWVNCRRQRREHKEHHAKFGKILRGRKDTLAPVVSTLRGERRRRSDASGQMSALTILGVKM